MHTQTPPYGFKKKNTICWTTRTNIYLVLRKKRDSFTKYSVNARLSFDGLYFVEMELHYRSKSDCVFGMTPWAFTGRNRGQLDFGLRCINSCQLQLLKLLVATKKCYFDALKARNFKFSWRFCAKLSKDCSSLQTPTRYGRYFLVITAFTDVMH